MVSQVGTFAPSDEYACHRASDLIFRISCPVEKLLGQFQHDPVLRVRDKGIPVWNAEV